MMAILRTGSRAIFFLLLSQSAIGANATREVFYEGFTVWLDCKQHDAVRFRYIAQRHTGNFPRSSTLSAPARQ